MAKGERFAQILEPGEAAADSFCASLKRGLSAVVWGPLAVSLLLGAVILPIATSSPAYQVIRAVSAPLPLIFVVNIVFIDPIPRK